MKLLKRLVTEIREVCPPRPFRLSAKLNSGDHIAEGGLMTDEVLEQARRLLECGGGRFRRDVAREFGASYFQAA